MKQRNFNVSLLIVLCITMFVLLARPNFKHAFAELFVHKSQPLRKMQPVSLKDSFHNAEIEEDWNVTIYYHNYTKSFTRFDVGKAKINFLQNFKSPCFLEEPQKFEKSVYETNQMAEGIYYRKKRQFSVSIVKSQPTFINNRLTRGHKLRLRCLPYFMLIGIAKSGTTDFTHRVLKHPLVFEAARKELFWWDQYRFLLNSTLSDYTDLFDESVDSLIHHASNDTSRLTPYYPGVIGEMTSITMTDVAYWREDPRNAGLQEPQYFTPHDIYSLNPNVKLIVLLRNPVTRLYSQYNMWSKRRDYKASAQDFHMRIVNSIKWWERCNKVLPLRNCLYGSPPEMPEVEHMLSSWWPDGRNYSGTLREGLYYFMLKDWLEVFPRENFLFIRSEDYKVHRGATINHRVFPFLGLPKMNYKSRAQLDNLGFVFTRKYEPMFNSTANILNKFYRPYNDKLAELLQHDKWKWIST